MRDAEMAFEMVTEPVAVRVGKDGPAAAPRTVHKRAMQRRFVVGLFETSTQLFVVVIV